MRNARSEESKNQRIAKNTTLMYIRMAFVMCINLYAVRLLLSTLGSEDYGIYNVVAGVVTMLSSVSSVLSNATQRFYSVAIAEGDKVRLRNVFSTSIIIYLLFALLIAIVGETFGLWFVNTQLVVPNTRMVAANWVYQFALFSFIVTLIQIPYSATLVAREEIGKYAIITTLDCIFKLAVTLLLVVIPQDSLIVYGVGLFLAHLLVFIIYVAITKSSFEECHFLFCREKILYKDILSFSGWSFWGNIAGVFMIQLNTILTNIFFGPIANAARGIALQLYAALSSFSNSFIVAVRSPMIKSYAEQENDYLRKLFIFSNKLILFCMLVICMPLLFEMNTIIKLWLKISDEQTILFARLILIYSVVIALHDPVTIIMQAAGKVKQYHLRVDTFTLLCVPLTYLFFKLGHPAYTTFVIMNTIIIVAHCIRLYCLKKYWNFFSMKEYILNFILPSIFIILLTCCVSYCTLILFEKSLLRFIVVFFVSTITILFSTYFLALSKEEKKVLKSIVNKLLRK